MSWQITYDAPRGLRTNRGFWALTTFGNLWWCEELGIWTDVVPKGMGASTHCHGPKTTKAFLRYLRKHPELKGHEVIFVNNSAYESTRLDITAVWVEE